MLDIKKVQEEAQKEVYEETMAEAKERLKRKMKELSNAKTIVSNLERELKDLTLAISEGN